MLNSGTSLTTHSTQPSTLFHTECWQPDNKSISARIILSDVNDWNVNEYFIDFSGSAFLLRSQFSGDGKIVITVEEMCEKLREESIGKHTFSLSRKSFAGALNSEYCRGFPFFAMSSSLVLSWFISDVLELKGNWRLQKTKRALTLKVKLKLHGKYTNCMWSGMLNKKP